MGNLYVPDGSWLVCSSGMKKQQIKVSSQTTIKTQNKNLATIKDRTGGNFICSKMVIAGALIGAAVGAAIFFTGGAAGVALGTLMAAGAAGGAAAGLASAISYPICAMTTLMYDWAPVHQNVHFEGKKALIGSSKLDCLFGGKIFITFSPEYADSIVNKNRVDTLRDTVVIIGLSYFGGNLIGGVYKGVPAIINSFKAKNWIALIQGATVVGLNYGSGLLYDEFKKGTGIDKIIKPNEEVSTTGTDLYDKTSSPEGGLPGGGEAINDVNTRISTSTTIQNTSIYQNRTAIVTPNGEIILPGTRAQQTTISTQTISSSTHPNASPATTHVGINVSASATSRYNSPSITQVNDVRASSSINIQTNFPDQLKSSLRKGLLENIIKDVGDFVTFNLMENYGDDEILKSLIEHEIKAMEGIKVRENQF